MATTKTILRLAAIGVAALLSSLTLGTTASLAASGTALGVDPDASAETSAETRVLKAGADIFIGDRVITGEKGLVQILFSDNTELVVGPGSSLLIEDYLLRDDGSIGKLAINALAGTFRFATGDSAKDRYLIKTPTGTIGVRGTKLDFVVSEAEGTEVLLFEGAVRLCNLNGVCVTLDGTCEIGTYDLAQSTVLGPSSEITGESREDLKARFRYAQSQGMLMREFWFEEARQCFNKPFEGGTPPSAGGTKGGDGEPDCFSGNYDSECYGETF